MLAAAGVFVCTPATAQQATSPSVSSAAEQPASHFHHGLYLSLAVGPAYIRESGGVKYEDNTEIGGQAGTASSCGTSFTGLLGGSPVPGLAIGGGWIYTTSMVCSGSVEPHVVEGGSYDQLEMEGVWAGGFIDAYPNPEAGTHIQLMLGLQTAGFDVRVSTNGEPDERGNIYPYKYGSSEGVGLGLGFGVGHAFWVSESWSMGALARINWAPSMSNFSISGYTRSGATESYIAPSLVFESVYY